MKQTHAVNASPVEIDLTTGPATSPTAEDPVLVALQWTALAGSLRRRWRPDACDADAHDRATIVATVCDMGDGCAVLDVALHDDGERVPLLRHSGTYRLATSAGMRHVDVRIGSQRALAASIDQTGTLRYWHAPVLTDLGVQAGGYDPPVALATATNGRAADA